jgi:hypothetical protein
MVCFNNRVVYITTTFLKLVKETKIGTLVYSVLQNLLIVPKVIRLRGILQSAVMLSDDIQMIITLSAIVFFNQTSNLKRPFNLL